MLLVVFTSFPKILSRFSEVFSGFVQGKDFPKYTTVLCGNKSRFINRCLGFGCFLGRFLGVVGGDFWRIWGDVLDSFSYSFGGFGGGFWKIFTGIFGGGFFLGRYFLGRSFFP